KTPTIAKTIAVIFVSLYKVILLVTGKSVFWFAVSTSLDYLIFALILLHIYRKSNGQKLAFSRKRAVSLLLRSHHFILSGVAVSVYGYIDRLMIKQLLTNEDVGYYAAATNTSILWAFVLLAIIDSMRPTIMQLYEDNKSLFDKRMKQLYALIIYLSIFVSICTVFLSKPIILLLYGGDYLNATRALRIFTWSIPFSYLGVARNIWIVCENKQHYLVRIYAIAALINIVLNYILIGYFGIEGAAITALITQICTCILIPAFYTDLKPNNSLIFKATILRF
ncbi:MAG: flippase, partial [Lentisphaerae bacterium]|nr:flippase [Lentisphaerota bacterium]